MFWKHLFVLVGCSAYSDACIWSLGVHGQMGMYISHDHDVIMYNCIDVQLSAEYIEMKKKY